MMVPRRETRCGGGDTMDTPRSGRFGVGTCLLAASLAALRSAPLSRAIYYAANIAAAPAGGNAVSVAFSQAAVLVDPRITEYSGMRTSALFDAGTSASGSGTTASSGDRKSTRLNSSHVK